MDLEGAMLYSLHKFLFTRMVTLFDMLNLLACYLIFPYIGWFIIIPFVILDWVAFNQEEKANVR